MPVGVTNAGLVGDGVLRPAELGFQILKTRTATNSTGIPVWSEEVGSRTIHIPLCESKMEGEQYSISISGKSTIHVGWVLAVGVFDSGAQQMGDAKSASHPDIRMRISTHESGKAYKCTCSAAAHRFTHAPPQPWTPSVAPPIGVGIQRGVASTLPREVALYADSRGAYWTRVINDLSGPIRLIFAPGRSPTATLMAHALCILLIWHRHLMVPTLAI